MKLKTLEVIKRAMSSTSNDETRPFLCGVHVFKSIDNEQTIVESTDGHIAFRESVIDDSYQEINIIISNCKSNLSLLSIFAKDAMTRPMGEFQHFEISSESFIFGNGDFKNCLSLISKEFPKLENVIPKAREENYRFAFNVDNLIKLHKSFGKSKNNHIQLQLQFDLSWLNTVLDESQQKKLRNQLAPTLSPILITKGMQDCFGILMPVKI